MHNSESQKSRYSDYLESACNAHARTLLRLALSGFYMKKIGKAVPGLSESDAKDCVQDVFEYFLKGIKNEHPTVMKAISEHPPDSDNILYLLIWKLQRKVIDIHRSRERYRVESDFEWADDIGAESERAFDDGGPIEWLLRQNLSPWQMPPEDRESAAIEIENSVSYRVIDLFEQAMLAGWFDSNDQAVVRIIVRETAGELTDWDAARELGVSRKTYQNLKSEVKGKLRDFFSAFTGGEHV